MKKIYQYKWLPLIAGLCTLVVILTQWQAVRRLERIHDDLDAVAKIGYSLSTVALAGGVFLSVLLTLSMYFAQTARLRQKELEEANRKLAGEATERKRLTEILEATPDFIATANMKGDVLYYNKGARKILGIMENEDISNVRIPDTHPEWAGKKILNEAIPAAIRDGVWSGETAFLGRDGREIPVLQVVMAHKMPDGTIEYLSTIARDITELKNLEEQLRQSQKMEAVGQLAAGIAHDFNNILSTIMGYSEILLMKMKEGDPLRKGVTEIATAGEKGAELVRNILVFSRKEEANYIPQDLNDIIVTVKETLLRLIGEDVEVKINLTNKKLMVLADIIQMEQVLLNLATNARDAMPCGGTITISTERTRLDEEFLKPFELCKPGEYALVTFTDSGIGMDEKTREKVFEPFFTTKDVGEGTGLGLSMVYGTIKRHNGCIDLCSKGGAGTTFKIYLPIIEAACGPS